MPCVSRGLDMLPVPLLSKPACDSDEQDERPDRNEGFETHSQGEKQSDSAQPGAPAGG